MNKLLYLIDDDFQSQQAAKCDLLVHIGLETFQYAIIDNGREQLKALAEFEIPAVHSQIELLTAIENLPESSRQFKYSFNRIKISFDTFHYTFIPVDLYKEENEQEYAKFIGATFESDVMVNTIRSTNIKNVIAIDSQLKQALNGIFQKPRIFNQASSFIEGIKKTHNKDQASSLFIDINSKHIQLAWLKNSELMFYNTFDCINADEFNYYLLNVLEQLDIDAEQTQVVLSGKIMSNDDFHQRVEKYFNRIDFADSRLLVKYPERFENVSPQAYFSLISLDLCE